MPKIFNTLDKIEPLYNWTYKVVMFICKILLIVDILVTTMAVCGRYISFIPDPAWSEQVVLTCMVYMAVLSATLAIHTNSHIRMTVFDQYLPPKAVKTLDVVSDVAVMILAVVLLVKGIEVCNSPLAKFGKYESLPWLSRVWMYVPIPLAGGSMIIFELEQLYQHIKAFFVKEVA
ncbi:MAG: TRAP transporter small permease [Christensenellales bacterium]|nr:TRAP transporter small permease [Christensenellales bacterium]